MNQEDIFILTAREYYLSAVDEFNKERYNSSVILFFKSLVSLCDLFILRETGESPSSHTKRFHIAEMKFPEIYDLLDKDFPFYQDSYVKIMSRELAEVIRKDVSVMAGKTGLGLS